MGIDFTRPPLKFANIARSSSPSCIRFPIILALQPTLAAKNSFAARTRSFCFPCLCNDMIELGSNWRLEQLNYDRQTARISVIPHMHRSIDHWKSKQISCLLPAVTVICNWRHISETNIGAVMKPLFTALTLLLALCVIPVRSYYDLDSSVLYRLIIVDFVIFYKRRYPPQ